MLCCQSYAALAASSNARAWYGREISAAPPLLRCCAAAVLQERHGASPFAHRAVQCAFEYAVECASTSLFPVLSAIGQHWASAALASHDAMREQQPLLNDTHSDAASSPAAAAVASTALPVRDATVSAARSLPSELSSFPCLSIETTTTLYTCFERIWNGAQSRSPTWLKPVFVHCEETELIGAASIAALVGCFVAAGFLIVFPGMSPGWLRGLLKLAFSLQVIVGYACLFLFRNVNPGYIPVNEGAIG